MKPKTMILMVVAVGCGLGASYMTSRLLAERSRQGQAEETVMVLVAKQKVPAFEPIREPEKYFKEAPFLATSVPKKAIRDFDALRNQRLNKPLDEDKPVSEDDLLNMDQLGLIGKMRPRER